MGAPVLWPARFVFTTISVSGLARSISHCQTDAPFPPCAHLFLFYGVSLVYDVTTRETFDQLPTWFNELETFASSSDVVKIIVGNKVDKVSLA